MFDGSILVDYRQFYITPPGGMNSGDMQAAFAGQQNGLCGAAHDGMLFLVTGLHYGNVALTIDLAPAPPEVDEQWEEIVEVPFVVSAEGGVHLEEWDGDVRADIPLAPGPYRVRYHGSGMDAAHQGEEVDRYLLVFWPAPVAPDAVVKTTSDSAGYWHGAWP